MNREAKLPRHLAGVLEWRPIKRVVDVAAVLIQIGVLPAIG